MAAVLAPAASSSVAPNGTWCLASPALECARERGGLGVPQKVGHVRQRFMRTMRTGNVGGRRLAPIMPWSEFAKLTDSDLKALWAFLSTIKSVAHDVERTAVDLKDNPAINDAFAASAIR